MNWHWKDIPSYERIPDELFSIDVDGFGMPVIVLPEEFLSERLRGHDIRIYVLLGFIGRPGNIKRIPASYMIQTSLATGVIKPGAELVEPTSGNMGVSLAVCAAPHDVRVTAIVANDLPFGKRLPLVRRGAKVLTESEAVKLLGLERSPGSIQLAEFYSKKFGAVFLNQYQNPLNPESYRHLIAPKFWDGVNGQASMFVSATGSCGTLLGLGNYFLEQNPNLLIVPTMPYLGQKIDGLRDIDRLKAVHDRRKLTTFDEQIDERTARAASNELNIKGIPGGPSSGAAFGTIEHMLLDRLGRGTLDELRCPDGTIGVITTFADTVYPYN